MALTKRVEVLFDPEEYRLVVEIARSHGETVGALVRRAVAQQYLKPSQERRQEAVRRIVALSVDFGSWEEAREAASKEVLKRLETP